MDGGPLVKLPLKQQQQQEEGHQLHEPSPDRRQLDEAVGEAAAAITHWSEEQQE